MDDSWIQDAYDNISQNNNDENIFDIDENSQRAFWNDVLENTTNIPGVLVEDSLTTSSTEAPASTDYYLNNGESFGPLNLSNDGVHESPSPSTVKNIYDKIFEDLAEDDQTTETEPSSAISSKLYPHQKQALNWMIAKENKNALPPFWEQREGYCVNTITNEKRQKVKSIRGGILADDMGLGKTLEMISLIITNFVGEKPLVLPLCDIEETPSEFPKQKTNKTRNWCQNNAASDQLFSSSSSSSENSNDDQAEKNTSTTASFSGLCNEQNYTNFGSTQRFVKRMFIEDEEEIVEIEKKHSPAKYAKLPEYDSVSTSSAEEGHFNSDSTLKIPDCDVITILDSDEEEEFDHPKVSGSKAKKDDNNLLETNRPPWSDAIHKEVTQGYDPLTGRCRTNGPRGTLIICPTSVLSNWKDQFKQHVDKTACIKVHEHYGKNRNLDVEFLKEQDVVITTYHTVIADNKNADRGPLYNTKWLRIVLDEGHVIRNPRTCTAKIIFELKAQRRWVLTGTPIQNSMEDLWSIVNFLKVEPLTDKRCWNRTIAYSMASNNDFAMQRVFHLMRSLSLRRTKTQHVNGKPVLDLPARKVVLKKLALNQEQRTTYDLLEKEGKIMINQYIKDNTVQDHLFEIYVAQLRLRQFCCHPKLVLKAVVDELSQDNSDTSVANNSLLSNTSCEQIDLALDEHAETCSVCFRSPKNTVIDSQGHAYCWTCIQTNAGHGHHQVNHIADQGQMTATEMRTLMDQYTSADKADEECILCTNILRDAVMTSRGHMYCRVCFKINPDITQAYERINPTKRKKLIGELLIWLEADEEYKECPICYMKSMEIGYKMAVITFCGHQFCRTCIEKLCMNQPQPPCPICREPLDRTKLIKVPRKLTEGSGNIDEWKSSAKLDALMTALTDLRDTDPSIKSIVVSQFTSLLDLIEKALSEKNFNFTRLDGKMTQIKRLQAMMKFSDTKPGSPTVFLLSLKAGGVGINLIAASRVFLMEPAWNPAAEEQCFDRCHRLGQTKDVEITKFIIENSIEENMLKLQDKKRGLMTGAFLKKLSKEERRANYINDLLDFFQDIV